MNFSLLKFGFIFFIFSFQTLSLAQDLNKIVEPLIPVESQVGVSVWNLLDNTPVININSKQLMLPASTQKLFIAVTAVKHFGTDYQFDTTLETNSEIKNGKIKGDVTLRFSGDPSFTSEELEDLFYQLLDRGINSIEGNIKLEAPMTRVKHAPGWAWDDLSICYAAPVSGFIINENCVLAKLSHDKSNKGVITFPEYSPLEIISDIYYDPKKLQPDCRMEIESVSVNKYRITGCFYSKKTKRLEFAIEDPQLFVKDYVHKILQTSGIRLEGKVIQGNTHLLKTTPHLPTILALHKSPKLQNLLDKMILESDNLIADSLTKKLGQDVFNARGDFNNGTTAIKKVFNQLGGDLFSAKLADGSGLSRYNLVNAEQIMQSLKLIYQNPETQSLLGSFPIAGKSGTLEFKYPFNHDPYRSVVKAKTGSMQGVQGLAGYILLPHKPPLAFVIIENGLSPLVKTNSKSSFSAQFLKAVIQHIKEQTEKTNIKKSL
ncbi:D-alanyl-D-alanine carboxypeptidase/D-alanyl-D-alanine-endopeptidase [Parashewanella spongiae]|nr:D-alanyl-D-alanine carboxypeptidase/D-alanyl-D-alanine-endopeptidase [Parashewanella spongiae]MCL1077210.1 D-alanyl-D-alanine carboxypeptidase/D-alanyl-D-alanine-endopeptidase [Parashewanella spongiae]